MAKQQKIGRRQFLKGAGGFSLAIPFMPSLLPGPAFGQEPIFQRQKRFIAITTNHGGIFESAMFPSQDMLTQSTQLYPGHNVQRGDLVSTVENNQRYLSNVLQASTNQFSEAMVNRMNVLRGIDIPFYIAHHTGGHLGNFARNDGNGEDGQSIQDMYMPTIDQLMAWSDNFYQDLSSVTLRSVITGSNGRMSYNWSNPASRSGPIEAVELRQDFQNLFGDVFKIDSGETNQTYIVDRVIDNYRWLRNSNRRISSVDAQRLDDHMDRLFELQRRLNATQQSTALCQNLSLDEINYDDYRSLTGAYVDCVEAAFLCGSSAVAVLGIHEEAYSSYSADWHQSVAHQWNLDEPQRLLQEVNQQVFENVFLELANRLDVEDAPGSSIIDSTLMVWTQECGQETHNSDSIPVVTLGSAGGFLSTGNYCDYRRLNDDGLISQWGEDFGYSGLTYNQWLATAMQAVGMDVSEWNSIPNNASAGYGLNNTSEEYARTQVAGVWQNANDVLPFLRAF